MDFRRHWESNVARFGAPATWYQAGEIIPLACVGFAVPKDNDGQVANALGYGLRMLTIRAIDTAGRTPGTLDRIDIAGEELTINSATPVVIAGTTIGWRCPAAGHSEGLAG
jgi:hypothetical protein